MANFFFGERSPRPGAYMCMVNIGKDRNLFGTATGSGGVNPDELYDLMVNYDGGIVTITLPAVSYVSFEDGVATIEVLPATVSHADGIVTIGG